jgi:hypothetical protein
MKGRSGNIASQIMFLLLLGTILDIEGPEKSTRGGGEWESIKTITQELAYVPSLNPKTKTLQESDEHTNQQHRNDPLKVINAEEKE